MTLGARAQSQIQYRVHAQIFHNKNLLSSPQLNLFDGEESFISQESDDGRLLRMTVHVRQVSAETVAARVHIERKEGPGLWSGRFSRMVTINEPESFSVSNPSTGDSIRTVLRIEQPALAE